MTIAITKTVRATIRSIVADSRRFDADTIRISRDGLVTAEEDYDKTFGAPRVGGFPAPRSVVGQVDDMVDAAGVRKQGY